jgi:hypothetical protein
MSQPYKNLEDIQEARHQEFVAGDQVWYRNPNGKNKKAEIIENLGSKWGLGVAYKIRLFQSYTGFDNKEHIAAWEHPKPVGFRDLEPRTDQEPATSLTSRIIRCAGIDEHR